MNKRQLFLGTLALTALTGAASAQISVSEHNFSGMAWSGGQICKPCHTPHNANVDQPRLWNHALTSATYQMHGGSGTAAVNFDTVSRMCLSCHDGTVALDSFGGATGTNFIAPGNTANLGTDLRNDHPVGSDAEYPPDPQPSWWAASMQTTPLNGLRLKQWTNPSNVVRNVVGCTTCHNAHNRGNIDPMLVYTNAASALCLSCHIK